jgi:hypothetical protein
MADGATTLVEEKPVTTSVGTKKSTKTGNLILDISHEVETMSKQKALQEAEKLAENVEVSYFKLGGILKLINDNSWFEGFPTFGEGAASGLDEVERSRPGVDPGQRG